MKLAKILVDQVRSCVAVIEDDVARVLPVGSNSEFQSLADILHADSPIGAVKELLRNSEDVALDRISFQAPIDDQEVWAAGVTYKRSQVARMEESESAASHYDKVYSADRPEIFYKGNAQRVSGPGQPVRVRFDSNWTVPEPEFTLVLNTKTQIVGYTIGNDMSARDIEGENPLYLPQAKVYRQCCGLGPVIRLADGPLDLAATEVSMQIHRDGVAVYRGQTSLAQLHRKLPDLANWLGREDDFPQGAFLLTGTGLVPDNDFSLEQGDLVNISITGIGALSNPVVKEARRPQ